MEIFYGLKDFPPLAIVGAVLVLVMLIGAFTKGGKGGSGSSSSNSGSSTPTASS